MLKRRNFIEFIGKGTAGVFLIPAVLQGCTSTNKNSIPNNYVLKGIQHTSTDEVKLAEGFSADLLIQWGDDISKQDRFGYNNDFITFVPNPNNLQEGHLWVNHEYIKPLFISGYKKGETKTKEQVDEELYNLGGSYFKVRLNDQNKWEAVQDESNFRVTGLTDIPFHWTEPIAGAKIAMGTLANCSGGLTPWGTVLTCEENYDYMWGETSYDESGEATKRKGAYGFEDFYEAPQPEHYGWVVEVDPKTKQSRKLVALGRMAHECCTMRQLPDGRVVAYTGDDSNDECFYKWVGNQPNDLIDGTLYVANIEAGKWESLNYDEQPALQERFKNQTEVLIRCREASKIVGGTRLNRPEDIEIDPLTGDVLVTLTNNLPKGDFHGSVLKLQEKDGAYDSLSFESSTYIAGGDDFSCPDNMAFDQAGNFWFTSDMSGSKMNKHEEYLKFKNNGLFVVPRFGNDAGKVFQVASAPNDAEFTGPWFSPDGKTLFLSVQHPGETSKSLKELTSNWPNGEGELPRSAVIQIQGAGIDYLAQLNTQNLG